MAKPRKSKTEQTISNPSPEMATSPEVRTIEDVNREQGAEMEAAIGPVVESADEAHVASQEATTTPELEVTTIATKTEEIVKKVRTQVDSSAKGPFATEEEARVKPVTGAGTTPWKLYEVESPDGTIRYCWECSYDSASAFVAKADGYKVSVAGDGRKNGNGLKSKLDAAEKRMQEMAAKLKAAGIEF